MYYQNNNKKLLPVEESISLYKVCKIDSINNYYIIYTRKDNNKYKIISKMEYRMDAEKIKLNERYNLKLQSLFNVDYFIDSINFNPSLTPNVECIYIDKLTPVCIDRKYSIFDLYKAINLSGLYINK